MSNTNNENENSIDNDLDLSGSFDLIKRLDTDEEIEEDDLFDSETDDKTEQQMLDSYEDEEEKSQKILDSDEDVEEDEVEYDNQESEYRNDEVVSISKPKIVLIKKLLLNIKENNDHLIQLLSGLVGSEDEESISIGQMSDGRFEPNKGETNESGIIEGVFDGENMIGPDGKRYSVPSNYASKSKMVEGDILKLTITANGTFIYKQIGPIERNRIIGKLEKNSDGNYAVLADNKKWRILTASITYFKGKHGDEVVVLVPKTGESKWAAMENVVKDKKFEI